LKTLDQMNLRVVRIWNLPIREPHDKPANGRMTWPYVQGPGQFKVERICLADELQDFSRVLGKSEGLTLTNDFNALYAEYLFRAKGTAGDWLSYEVPGPMQSVKIVAFCAKDLADLTLQVSADGRIFTPIQPQRSVRRLGSPMSGPAAGQSRTLLEYECAVPTGNRYLKLLWIGPAELDRVEIYYK
jgi:hypothetical protein